MPDEYQLKYSGEKIDELLTKIDNLGTGNDTTAGILKLSDSTNETHGVSDGIAATPSAVKSALDSAEEKINAQKPAFKTVSVETANWVPGNYSVTWDDGGTSSYTACATVTVAGVTADSRMTVSDRTRVTDAVRMVAALEPGDGVVKFYANAAPTSAAVFVLEVSQ